MMVVLEPIAVSMNAMLIAQRAQCKFQQLTFESLLLLLVVLRWRSQVLSGRMR